MNGRLGEWVRSAWIGVGVFLLVFTLLENGTKIVLASRERWREATRTTALDVRPTGEGRPPWAREYDREFENSYQVRWHPYVYWRKRPYSGKYINIDDAGIRRTWNRTLQPEPGQMTVFMLGGSVMWGTGARDEFTIPSFVSKRLAGHVEKGVWVTNFAEGGYVSTQEVIGLMRELQQGHVPDIVVFLDGVNDTFSAYQSGVAGIPQSEQHRASELNSRTRLNLVDGFVTQLALYRLAMWTRRSIRDERYGMADRRGPPLSESLPDEVVEAYLRNVAIVNALAKKFGFRAVFYWQPTTFSRKNPPPQGRQLARQFERRAPGAVEFFRKVNEVWSIQVRREQSPHVYDLQDIFDESERTMFLDQIHLTEEGNDRVAEVMVRTLLPLARRTAP